MMRVLCACLAFLGTSWLVNGSVRAGKIEHPQPIKTRYEAADQKAGGQFVVWSERERIYYGLHPKLYPAARYVEVVQVTLMPGSVTLTCVVVRTITASTSDYLYLSGNLRFRVSGMILKSSNFPDGTNMSAKSAE